jgi:general secretion pathway protein L
MSLAPVESPEKMIQVYLHFGHKKTLLSAFHQQRLIFSRSLMWGADAIIQEIIRKYQISPNESQKILSTQASLYLVKKDRSFEELNLSSTIEKCLRDLTRDLQISLLELKSENTAVIQNIYFSGGLGEIPNLGAFLTQNLEIPCNRVYLLQNYTSSNIPPQFAPAAAIAIEAFKKPKNPALQFIKGEFVQGNNTFKIYWEEWGQITQIGLAAILVLFTWGYFREDFSSLLSEKGTEVLKDHAKNVAKLPKKQANEKGVTKYIKDHKKRTQEMKLVQQVSSMNSAMDLLKKLSEIAPPLSQAKIDLVEFSVQDEKVKISGYADSPKEVNLLTQKLLSISLDKKINEEPHQFPVQQNRVSFSISLKMDRGLVQ